MTLEILTSDLLMPFRHGFFTRRGGASSGVFAGLNCGRGSTDQREIVSINRVRVAEAMQVPLDRLRTVRQVHSNGIVVAEAAPPGVIPEADGLVTATPGLALAVLTADCLPILLADPDNGVVGAVHAGWRGTLGGVIEAALRAMVGLGAQVPLVRAAIGPAISQAAYEVGPDLYETFRNADADAARFFVRGRVDRMHLDLPGYALHRLDRAGVTRAGWTGHCTYADPVRFYSYRRATHRQAADYGRLMSVIRS